MNKTALCACWAALAVSGEALADICDNVRLKEIQAEVENLTGQPQEVGCDREIGYFVNVSLDSTPGREVQVDYSENNVVGSTDDSHYYSHALSLTRQVPLEEFRTQVASRSFY